MHIKFFYIYLIIIKEKNTYFIYIGQQDFYAIRAGEIVLFWHVRKKTIFLSATRSLGNDRHLIRE